MNKESPEEVTTDLLPVESLTATYTATTHF